MKIIDRELVVKASDKKNIYCTLGLPTRKTKRIVLMVHGLASTEYWSTMVLGSWYFRKHGYAFCRINLYHWKPGARSLMTSDLSRHSKDVDDVVRSLKKQGYTKIYAVGHSFGGLTLLGSSTRAFSAISLWECSSFKKYSPRAWLAKDKATGATYAPGSYELMMSKRYIKGMMNFPDELKLASKITRPVQICYAGGKRGMLIDSSKRYFDSIKSPKELHEIPDASHSFTEEEAANILFRKTLRWFNKNA